MNEIQGWATFVGVLLVIVINMPKAVPIFVKAYNWLLQVILWPLYKRVQALEKQIGIKKEEAPRP